MFFKKKEEAAKPATSPSGQFEPATVTAPAAAPAGGDLFGGMAVVRRKKKGQSEDPPVPPSANPSPPSPPATQGPPQAPAPPPEPAAPAPFFAKFELKYAAGDAAEDAEDPETARIRARLERFYEEYNPSKLSQVDTTLKAYEGREAELFSALIAKYGPEPVVAAPKQPPPKTASAKGSKNASAAPEPAAAAAAAAPVVDEATSAAAGFGFGDAASDSGGFGGGGFGFATDAAAGGWGDAPSGGFEGGGGGFGFTSDGSAVAADPAAGTAGGCFGDASGGGGFGFATDAPAAGGFDIATADASGAGGGFGLASGGFAHESVAPVPTVAPAQQQPASSSDDDDDELTVQQRHANALRDMQGDVLLGRSALSDAIGAVTRAIQDRKAAIDAYAAVETQIEECIAREDFALADQLTAEFDTIAATISDQAASAERVARTLPSLRLALHGEIVKLSDLYTTHRIELLETRGEEERAANKYVAENTSRLELAGEKVRAALDRATRALHNSSQEVVNLEQRRQKVVEKISESTKGLRAQRDDVSSQKDTLEHEIAELEAKLATKRRMLATTKVELTSLNEKLAAINADHADTMSEVDRQLDEERARQGRHQVDVDALTQQQESVLNEERTLREEKVRLSAQLAQNNDKIENYAGYAKTLRGTMPQQIDAYVLGSTTALLETRQRGISILAPAPAAMGALDAATDSPLADLNKAKAQLLHSSQAVQTARAEESVIALRQQEIAKNTPVLEAAKKSFAAAKQFKEAQAKSEELKKLQEESVALTRQLGDVQQRIADSDAAVMALETKVAAETAAASRKIDVFVGHYRAILLAVHAKVATAPNLLLLSDEELGYQPDDLQQAMAALVATALAEYNAAMLMCGQPPLEALAAGAAPATPSVPHDAPAAAAVASGSASSSSSSASDAAEQQDVEAAAAEEVVEKTPEELRAELDALNTEMELAIEQEDYEGCEALQLRIDAINAKLADE